MPQLAHHNPEINWKTEKIKMTRCLKECGRQQRLKQGKSGQQKQKKKEKKEEKEEEKKKEKKKKKRNKIIDIKKVAKEQEIWDKKEKATRLEEKAKKLVLKQFHRQIKILGKKTSERMPTKKMWDYMIYLKEIFVPRKEKVYLCLEKKERK